MCVHNTAHSQIHQMCEELLCFGISKFEDMVHYFGPSICSKING